MDKVSFETLIAELSPEVKAKGIALYNGVLAGLSEYNKEKTAANLKNWQASETAFDEFINSISSTPTNEKTFKGVPAVVEYLHSQGWKISLRTGYNHRDKKILLPRKDGKYYQSDIDRYAASGELQRIDGIKPELSDADSDRKRKAEADTAECVARINKVKADAIEGKYIDREIFEDELSVQALQFRNSIVTFINSMAEEIVSYIGGDVSRIPDLIEFMLTRADEHFVKCAEQMELTGPLVDIDKIDTSDTDDDNEDRETDSYDGEGARC